MTSETDIAVVINRLPYEKPEN